MNGKEFKKAVDFLSDEKGIDKETIYEAMELALTSAYKKNYHLPNVRVEINKETGDIKIFSFKTVVFDEEWEKEEGKYELETFTDEDGNELKVEDILCDIDSDFVLEYENSESYQIIRKIVDELSDEDKNIIVKYFGFMNYPSMSQCEIANELGVSQGQVSRIIKRNLKKISVQLELQGIIEVSTRVCSTKQDCNATSKRLKTIYEYFYKYPREQIDVMLSKLNEEDKSLLFLRYGNDLDHPVPGEGWNREISKHFYNRLLPKMKKMLANPYYSSQNKRRVMKR